MTHARSRSRPQSPPGTDLRASLEQFAQHLLDYRDYAPGTVKAYRQEGECFISFLEVEGIECVEAVERQHAHRFAARLTHLSPASIRRRIYALRAWFRYLTDLGIIAANPLAGVSLPKRRPKLPTVPTTAECERLLGVCQTPRERALITLMLLCGLRKAEVLGLNVEDVSAGCEHVRVRGKGGKDRVVPLCRAAREAVQACLEHRKAETNALLTGMQGGRLGHNSFYRLFRRLLWRAGLEQSGLIPHGLRHAFATELIRAGVDVATVAELLGHANISTTAIYLHSDTRTKRAAVERLPWGSTSQRSQAEPAPDHAKAPVLGAAQLSARDPCVEVACLADSGEGEAR